MWDDEDTKDEGKEPQLLASAYRSSLELASQYGIRTIAFPSISTGAYAYPLDEAAPIALRAVREYLEAHPEIVLVRFVLWGGAARVAYEKAAKRELGVSDERRTTKDENERE